MTHHFLKFSGLLPLLLALLSGTSVMAKKWSCSESFKTLTRKTSSKIVRLNDKDPRILWHKLGKKSRMAKTLENIVSPSVQSFYIHEKASGELLQKAKDMANASSSCVDTLESMGLSLSQEEAIIVSNFEKRFRLVSEIINAAFVKKYGHLSINERSYAESIHRSLTYMADEIPELQNLKEKLVQNENRFINEFLATDDLLSLRIEGQDFLKDDFFQVIEPHNLQQNMDNISNTLLDRLEKMPIGISYRPLELTNTVRFGNRHFYGNWMSYRSTSRAAYKRGARRLKGMFDVEFRASTRTKKSLGISLDRMHRKLDYFFGQTSVCDRIWHSCGTYPPSTFLSHGIPAISPFYIAPEIQNISYAIQRMLMLPHIKSFSFSEHSLLFPVAVAFIGHGISITYLWEITLIYGSIVYIGYKVLNLIIDEEE